jgi:hypothetical protein
MSKLFNNVQFYKPKKNKFDLSHEKKMSFKMGYLTPFMVQEVLPGDSFRVKTEMMMRLQPMLAPIFHRVRVKTDYFFVPNRLVWDNWQKFITGGDKGTDAPVHPRITLYQGASDNTSKGTLWDYMGLPVIDTTVLPDPISVNALPFRAYQLIYNEYFRDQNLIDPIAFSKGDGEQVADYTALLTMRKRAWEKDYFTSCLPWAQKQGNTVTAPADVVYSSMSEVRNTAGTIPADAPLTSTSGNLQAGSGVGARIENIDDIGININDLRVSVRLQEWFERQARAGSRYIETILSNWGVLSSDARLQRPEYLGGSINPN